MFKSLLITGGAGFIASNFVHYWLELHPQDKIIVLDSLNYASNINSIKSLIENKKIEFIRGNIIDQNLIIDILRDHKITHLINFAAETHVDRSINNPLIFLETNVLGTYTILECFKKHWEINQKNEDWRFLHISTDEVFGSLEADEIPFSESSPYQPRSPYAASKASSDHLVRAWHETYGLPILITNCSNNYGPFQFPEKLIPLTITNIIRNKKIQVYGDGLNIRDWLFVKDHCSAIDVILHKAVKGNTYCIGGNNELTNIDLIYLICDLVDKYAPEFAIKLERSNSKELINYIDDRLGHDRRYAINSHKLFSDLKWEPKTKFKDGIRITVQWYLKNREWWENL